MCLKEYHIITFSNREAYLRALRMLSIDKRLMGKPIRGTLYKIIGWKEIQPQSRKDFSFEELLEFSSVRSSWIEFEKIDFYGFVMFKEAIEKIGDHEDIFGKIEVEVR